MFDTWKIVTNHNERRILVVNGILSEEYKKELRWEDYEAIFIESFFGQASQDYQAIFSIHPLLVNRHIHLSLRQISPTWNAIYPLQK